MIIVHAWDAVPDQAREGPTVVAVHVREQCASTPARHLGGEVGGSANMARAIAIVRV